MAVMLAGCRTADYYGQAMSGQMEIWRKQVPVEEIVSTGGEEAEVRRKLVLIQDLRVFATDGLDLPAGDDYTKYADLGREHVVWNVIAAPEFSLESKSYWYPVVGTLEYRGFFKEEDADAFADELVGQGYDVYVGGVDAYSTLGWFADPVLNTFMRYTDTELAELVFHELTHQRLFVSGETAFNEALATAVSEEGTRRWLNAIHDTEGLTRYGDRLARKARIYREIAAARSELKHLYATPRSEGVMRERKAIVMTDLQDRLRALSEGWGPRMKKAWLERIPNNAILNATATYYEYVPRFERMIREEDGDLDRFFERVGKLDVDQFLEP
ncbi:MAG: aminopeptidase [Verrucomicrobia bacterium]|nr:MAG: aminopeptidase [Verrucomicrobiota bacterium]